MAWLDSCALKATWSIGSANCRTWLLGGESYDALADWLAAGGRFWLKWLRRLRRGGVDTPVIILTARTSWPTRSGVW